MKFLKRLNNKVTKIITGGLLISIILLYTGVYIYSLVFEQDGLTIDRYNFGQLKKVKSILKDVPEKEINFYNIKDFNETYDADIKPIKNCYYLNYSNGNKPYIFGFQLESLIYKFIYFGKNYAYPSYSIPREQYCFGEGAPGGCHYTSKEPFIDKISNPCN